MITIPTDFWQLHLLYLLPPSQLEDASSCPPQDFAIVLIVILPPKIKQITSQPGDNSPQQKRQRPGPGPSLWFHHALLLQIPRRYFAFLDHSIQLLGDAVNPFHVVLEAPVWRPGRPGRVVAPGLNAPLPGVIPLTVTRILWIVVTSHLSSRRGGYSSSPQIHETLLVKLVNLMDNNFNRFHLFTPQSGAA